MGLLELFLIAVGLSMDAFAVAVCKGLAMDRVTWRQQGIVGLYFGIFQGVMPLIGYYLGAQFESSITAYDHWIAFVLLGAIGGKMVWESLRPPEEDIPSNAGKLDGKTMLPLAVATSIDALAVGISFAFLEVQIAPAAVFIGAVTFLLSFAGVKIGQLFGLKFQARAEFAGGVILILMGIKILLEHLGYINW